MGEYSQNVNKFLWNSTGTFQTIDAAAPCKGLRELFHSAKQKFLTLHIKTMTKGNWSGFSKVQSWNKWLIYFWDLHFNLWLKEQSRIGGFVQRTRRSLFKGNFRTGALNVRWWKWGNTNPKHLQFIRSSSGYWIFNSLSLNYAIRLLPLILYPASLLHFAYPSEGKSWDAMSTSASTVVNTNIL